LVSACRRRTAKRLLTDLPCYCPLVDDSKVYHQPGSLQIDDAGPKLPWGRALRPTARPSVNPGTENQISFSPMTPTTASSPLAHFEDGELAQLAGEWRARALRGDRQAYGPAHALEVEQRRRRAPRPTIEPAGAPAPAVRPWWKFWEADPSAHSSAQSLA
jgi:hypothetical protein